MTSALIQAYATGISTVIAAAAGATVGIIHAIAVYRGKVAANVTNNGDTTNNGGM